MGIIIYSVGPNKKFPKRTKTNFYHLPYKGRTFNIGELKRDFGPKTVF